MEKNQENPKALINYSHATDHVYENVKENNATKKRKVLKLFYNMIVDMKVNSKLSPLIIELFYRLSILIFLYHIFILQ